MKNKKWLMILASVMLCAVLTACGAANDESENAEPVQESEPVEESQEAVEEVISEVQEETPEAQDETQEVQEEAQEETQQELGTYPDGTSPVYSGVKCKLTVDGEEIIIAMYDNTAATAFLERLPLEDLNFFDLSGIEKPVEIPEEAFSIGEEEPGYDPVTGEMVIYRPWGNFTFFYGDFRHSDELVPLGKVESGLEILAGKTEDFTGTLEVQ